MNKKGILKLVKEKIGESSIRFPKGIDFQEENCVITLTMQKGISENMQNDSAAFEAWALCLKASLDVKCCLKWNKPANPDGHYQRFLYRVYKFNSIFGGNNGWFSIADESKLHMADFKIEYDKKYFLNSPSTRGENRRNDNANNRENRLENQILGQEDHFKDLKGICPVKLQRQLPVGVFNTEVKETNAIFPHQHSAIDLWGTEGDVLYILELKAERNLKVGVLSEFFFYTMVMRDEQHGKFIRETCEEGRLISETNKIKAFILAPKLHPFITRKVFALLNEKLGNQDMEFGYIKFDYTDTDSKLMFNSFIRVY